MALRSAGVVGRLHRLIWVWLAMAVAALAPKEARAQGWPLSGDGTPFTVTGTLGVDSVSAFRGVKSTKLNPSVFGAVELERGDVFAGVFTNPTSIAGEVRPLAVTYVGYSPRVGKFDLGAGARYYAFIASSDFSFDLDDDGVIDHTGKKGFSEVFASVSRNVGALNFRARAFYAPNVFAETGGALYLNGRVKAPLGAGFDIQGDFGVSEFEREQFNDEYIDYGVSVYKSVRGFDLYLRYSNTTGLAGTDDRLVAFGIERSWSFSPEADRRERMRRKILNRDWSGDKALFGFPATY